MFISNSGNIGIGKIPTHKLDIKGDFSLEGALLVSLPDVHSSRTFVPANNSLAALKNLNIYSFEKEVKTIGNEQSSIINGEEISDIKQKTIDSEQQSDRNLGTRSYIGFDPIELQAALPQMVRTMDDGSISVDYLSLVPVLTNAIKQQQNTIEMLEAKVLELEQQITQPKK